MEKKKETRISVVVDQEFLLELKKRALNRNMTMKNYITGILARWLIEEKKSD